MAKKSIYETSFAAGHTGGLYEAELQGVGDVWSDIESSRAMTATKGERRERTLDTILAATELTSQVAGGLEARQEFKSHLKQVGASIDPSGKTSFSKVKTRGLKKLFQQPSYKIGDIQMSKSDITIAGQMLQYGGKPDYTRFKPESMSEEVGGFYGERKGFDMGDIIGEKSVFAAGLNKGNKPPPPPEPEKPKYKIESEEVDIADDVEVKDTDIDFNLGQDWKQWKAPEVGDTRPGQKTEPLINRVIGLGRDIGQNVWDLWN